MKEKENNLFEMTREAQSGNQEAMIAIIQKFNPLIKKMRNRVKPQDREDFEQEILEKVTRAILTYDLNAPTDITQLKSSIRSIKQNSFRDGGGEFMSSGQTVEFDRGDTYPLHLIGLPKEDEQDRLLCVVSLHCRYCLSLFNQLHNLKENNSIKFLLVTNGTDKENMIVKEQFGFSFIMISFVGRRFSDIGINGVPQAYLIDRHGIVQGRKFIKNIDDINLWMEEAGDGIS